MHILINKTSPFAVQQLSPESQVDLHSLYKCHHVVCNVLPAAPPLGIYASYTARLTLAWLANYTLTPYVSYVASYVVSYTRYTAVWDSATDLFFYFPLSILRAFLSLYPIDKNTFAIFRFLIRSIEDYKINEH